MSKADIYKSRRVGAAVRSGFIRIGKQGTVKEKARLKKDLYKLWTEQIGTPCPLMCNRKLTPRKTAICHDIALALGGKHDISNIYLACSACNRSQKTLTKNEYLKLREIIIENFGEELWLKIRRWMAGAKY